MHLFKQVSEMMRDVLERMWRKEIPCALLMEIESYMIVMENGLKIPQKTQIELPRDPDVSSLSIHPRK